jgi:hypothetical protein
MMMSNDAQDPGTAATEGETSRSEEPSVEELQEPSTEKEPSEEPKAPKAGEPQADHEAVGIGIVGRPQTDEEAGAES